MQLTLPSDRNFEVYHEVKIGGLSLRAAAKVFGISAHRVQEICQQVEAWYEANAAEWARDYDPEVRAVAAWRKNLLALDQLYVQTMRAWHGLTEPESPEMQAPVGQAQDRGQTRFISLAARLMYQRSIVATAMAKLPREWFSEGAARDADALGHAPTESAIVQTEPSQAAQGEVSDETPVIETFAEETTSTADEACSPPVGVFAPPAPPELRVAERCEVASEPTVTFSDDLTAPADTVETSAADVFNPLRSQRRGRRARRQRERMLAKALAKSNAGGGKRLAKTG